MRRKTSISAHDPRSTNVSANLELLITYLVRTDKCLSSKYARFSKSRASHLMSGAALQWGERIKLVLREPLERSQEITTKLIMEGLASAGVSDFESQSMCVCAHACSRA